MNEPSAPVSAAARIAGIRLPPPPGAAAQPPPPWRIILHELRSHVPFTALGTLTGLLVLGLVAWTNAPRSFSSAMFWLLHPLHVLLSALVTTAMYRRHGGTGFWRVLAIGYCGSVGIATLSDNVLPFAGEWLLDLPRRGLHLGFIEKAWLVNPLALAGIALGTLGTRTHISHAGHVLLSTWASLFHMTMAMDGMPGPSAISLLALFLFLSVWLPCCTSDIVFPLIFTPGSKCRRRAPPAALIPPFSSANDLDHHSR